MMNAIRTNTTQLKIKVLSQEDVKAVISQFDHASTYKYAISPNVKAIPHHNDLCYYAAYHDTSHSLVGYMHGYFPKELNTLWIQTFVIHPDYIRQGLGTQFYHQVIKQIEIYNPLTTIYLSCYDANDRGRLFWHSLGFLPISKAVKEDPTTDVVYKFTIYQNHKTTH